MRACMRATCITTSGLKHGKLDIQCMGVALRLESALDLVKKME